MGNFFKMVCSAGGVGNFPSEIVSIYLDMDTKLAAEPGLWKEEPKFVSSHCTIAPCIQVIKSEYKQAERTASPYREEVLKSWTSTDLNPSAPSQVHTFILDAPVAPEYGLYGQTFSVDFNTMLGIYNFMVKNFNGYYDKPSTQMNSFLTEYGASAEDTVSAIWNGNFSGCAYPENRVSCAADLIAKALSKTFRDEPYVVNGTRGSAGVAFSPVIHVRVTWYWITLPVLIWALACVTFVGTVWKSSAQVHVWRNSPLPIVFMKVESDDTEDVQAGADRKTLERRAKKVKGRVEVSGGQVAFVRV